MTDFLVADSIEKSAVASPRDQATAQRKQQVVAAALACFTEKGVEKTTVADICQRSGCSVGSLYHHFGNKEGVAGELFIHAIELLNNDLLDRLLTAHPDYARYLHSGDVEFTPAARSRLREIYRAHIEAVFEWFHPFVAGGEMRALPPETYVPLISGPIRRLRRCLRRPPGMRLEQLTFEFAANIVLGESYMTIWGDL